MCSDHFVDGIICGIELFLCRFCHVGYLSKLHEETSPSWIPSLKLGWDAEIPDSERYYCAEQRKRRKLDSDAAEVVEEPVEEGISTVLMVDVACETDDCSWIKKKLQSASLSVGGLESDENKAQAEVLHRYMNYCTLVYQIYFYRDNRVVHI